jgi:hypothetical protein
MLAVTSSDGRNARRLLRLRERATHLESRIAQRDGSGQPTSYEEAELSALREAIARWEIFDQRLASDVATLKARLLVVSAEERVAILDDLFDGWCAECGGEMPCHCWNDE